MFRVFRRNLASISLPLALLAGVFSQFASPLHQMLAVHRVSPENGDLLEDTRSTVVPPAAMPGAPVVSSGDGSGAAAGHSDEHCALCSQRESLVSALVLADATAQPIAEYPAASTSPAHESVDLLRLAPKSSPPA
jgi:hypothetical protein